MRNATAKRPRKNKARTPWQRRRRRTLLVIGVALVPLAIWFVWRVGLRAALNDARHAEAELGVVRTLEAYEERFGPYQSSWGQGEGVEDESPYRAVHLAFEIPPNKVLNALPVFRGRAVNEAGFAVPYPSSTVEALDTYMALNGDAYALLREALESDARVPAVRVFLDNMVELLGAAICLRAHEGDADGVYRAMTAGLTLLQGGGNMEADLYAGTKMDELDRLFNALGSAMPRVRLGGEHLNALREALRTDGWETHWKKAQLMRRSSFFIDFGGTPWGQDGMFNLLTGGFDREWLLDSRAWAIRYNCAGLTYQEQREIFDQHDDRQLRWRLQPVTTPVRLEVLGTALDVIRFERERGVLPADLEALTPEYCDTIPADFWSGEALRYQVDGRRFNVYSVGRNRKDDGGDGTKDVVFTTVLATHSGLHPKDVVR